MYVYTMGDMLTSVLCIIIVTYIYVLHYYVLGVTALVR